MRMTLFWWGVAFLAAAAAAAEDLVAVNGMVFTNATVLRITSANVVVRYGSCTINMPLASLSQESRAKCAAIIAKKKEPQPSPTPPKKKTPAKPASTNEMTAGS
jgi:hypothetical protein